MKKLMFTQPAMITSLLDKLTTVTIDYLQAQIDAGVDSLQLFDTWASHLSWDDYQQFSLPFISKIVEKLKGQVPLTVFCKGSSVFAPLIAQLPIQALGLDWQCSLPEIRRQLGPQLALQGNLDPYWLYGDPDLLMARVDRILGQMGSDPGYIFNLGHGIMPDIQMDQIRRVVDRVQNFNS